MPSLIKAPLVGFFKNGVAAGLESQANSAADFAAPIESIFFSGKPMAASRKYAMDFKASTSSSNGFEKAPCKERSAHLAACSECTVDQIGNGFRLVKSICRS